METIHGYLTTRRGWAYLEKEYAVRKLEENNRTLGVTSASWLQKTSLVFVSLQQFSIHPWAKVSLWELWDPVHVPRDLGRLPHICASGKKHGDLTSGVDPVVACELALVPLSYGRGAPVSDNHPWMRGPLWKSWFPKKFQHTIGPKNMRP